MDYFLVICSVIIYVENRLMTNIDYVSLEKATGFSLAHIRDIFAQKTGKPLSKYILERKISNAAFEIIHSQETFITIAEKYGFTNADTFTRAFKRITGLVPSDFRKRRMSVSRVKLCAGVYGVGLPITYQKGDGKNE